MPDCAEGTIMHYTIIHYRHGDLRVCVPHSLTDEQIVEIAQDYMPCSDNHSWVIQEHSQPEFRNACAKYVTHDEKDEEDVPYVHVTCIVKPRAKQG